MAEVGEIIERVQARLDYFDSEVAKATNAGSVTAGLWADIDVLIADLRPLIAAARERDELREALREAREWVRLAPNWGTFDLVSRIDRLVAGKGVKG